MTQVPFLMGAESLGVPVAEQLVVLVAETAEERTRLMSRMGSAGPVLVVSSAEEARDILESAAAEAAFPQRGPMPAGASSAAAEPPSGTVGIPVLPVAHLAAPELRVIADRHIVAAGGREAKLTPLEFALFSCLVSDLGRVWAFGELSERVWGTSHVGDGSQVHAVVKRLRRKLTGLSAPVAVEAIRGIGFRAVGSRTAATRTATGRPRTGD